jgi:hypothetical protein
VSLQGKKMLLAPVLAITLAILLAGTSYYLPFSSQSEQQIQPSPEPTIVPSTSVSSPTENPTAQPPTPTYGSSPMPSPIISSRPTASPSPVILPSVVPVTPKPGQVAAGLEPILLGVAAIAVGIVVVYVFFSKKSQK